jgi:hypothetical protein
MTTGEDLAAALADLGRASRHRLAEQWAGYFGAPPPPRTSRSQIACRMIDWSHPQLPLANAAEECVAGYLKRSIELFPDIHQH